jgi:amino acid adenylation domain-containing protein
MGRRRWPWAEIHIETADPAGREAELERIERAELAQDLLAAGGMLARATLIHGAAGHHTLLVTCHHLIGDGWSSIVLLRDLLAAYGSGGALPPLVPDYAAVVRALAGRDPVPARRAWSDVLRGAQPTLLFEEVQGLGAVRELPLAVRPELAATLEDLRRRRGLTLSTLMQGVWATFLTAMAGRDDVVFGSPVSGRGGAVDSTEHHVGLFTNTLPVRLRLQPGRSLFDQLAEVQDRQIRLLEHDGLGLGEIQRLAGTSTLFDTLLVVENYPEDAALFGRDAAGLRCVGARNRGHTHYPLTLMVLPDRPWRIHLEYREGILAPERLAERLVLLLERLAAHPDAPLASFDLQTPRERGAMNAVNRTGRPLPPQTLCELLARQAELSPEAPALADAEHVLGYREVRAQVVRLAGELAAAGVVAGDRVAVALPRSVQLSLALMAVLECGAAYLPLDTGYPDERLAYMIEDARPRLIITSEGGRRRFEAMAPLFVFDRLEPAGGASRGPRPTPPTPDHPAYVIYTSGSTGRPKGVVVSHRAIVNRLLWMQAEYGLEAGDVVLQKTPSSFDVSVWEFFWPLIAGARLVMAPPEAHRDPEELLRLIDGHRVTTMHFVPSMLAAFLAAARGLPGAGAMAGSLRRVFCSGEALSRELAEGWQALFPAPLHNLYGPTEAAVDVTYQPASGAALAAVRGGGVPIGRPVWNTGLRILDAWLRPVPLGVAGELYLTGVQLAQGYWRRPSLTAGRFVADPQADPQAEGQRMYRTGDIARWLPDGTVDYLGRSDDQIKIRGQRIELGEIEGALLDQPGVGQAVVQARSLAGGGEGMAGADGRQLVGYVVPAADGPAPDGEALRAALGRRLPAHMVPAAIVFLPELPLSANGKLDRKALPAPGIGGSGGGRKPLPGIETALAEIFARVLGVEAVDADDDFFALGGHSLLAMRLAAELRRAFDTPVPVGQVMVAPSVEALAAALFGARADTDRQAGFGDVLPLRPGDGPPLVCIHPASGFAWQFSALSRYLDAHWPVIGLQSPRPHGPIAAAASMAEMCEWHLGNLRKVQPHGPYHLIGYSLGGTVAQGMAALLAAQGEKVAFLGLLDTYPPETQDWTRSIDENAEREIARERDLFMAASDDAVDPALAGEKAGMFGDITANYDDSVRLLSAARTARYEGEATLFVARRTLPADMDVQATWKPYVGSLRVVELDCGHTDIVSPASLRSLGPILDGLLAGLPRRRRKEEGRP